MNNKNNNINSVNIYNDLSNQNIQIESFQTTKPIQQPLPLEPQLIPQHNELSSPSTQLPSYDNIVNASAIMEQCPLQSEPPGLLIQSVQPIQPTVQLNNSKIPYYDEVVQNEFEFYGVDAEQYAIKPNEPFPRYSILAKCNHCNKLVHTKVSFESNEYTFACCVILFCLTCILWILPLCLHSFKDCIHYCPICRREIRRNLV